MPFVWSSSVILLWVVVLLNLLLTLGIIRRMNDQSTTQKDPYVRERLHRGEAAPDFTAETLDGQQVTLATYTGKAVVFHFLSTRCGPCRTILPDLLEAAPLAARASIAYVFVLLDEASQVRSFVEEYQLTVPVLVAPQTSNPFAKDYKSTGTPSYCFVNGQGVVLEAGHPKRIGWRQLVESWKKFPAQALDTVTTERR